MLSNLVAGDVFALFFVFARVGAAIMLMPGFGEVFVSARTRLLLAVAITLVVTPLVSDLVPANPDGPLAMLMILGREIVIGLFLGSLSRALVAALHMSGVIIGFQTSLSNAQMFDPLNASQGSLIGSFLNVLGVFLIFAADLHHLLLMALVDSYVTFAPGATLPIGDFSVTITRAVGDSFRLAMQMSAPFMVMGMLFYLGLGLLARLMPQVQVFFIAIPIQIIIGILVMIPTLSVAMMWFLGGFENRFQGILLPGLN
ncbi:MAG: flagellar biosynthetic protein FliR [Alphaproteobacteria bacterium]